MIRTETDALWQLSHTCQLSLAFSGDSRTAHTRSPMWTEVALAIGRVATPGSQSLIKQFNETA